MRFRQARHTNLLEPIIAFYTQIIGLKELGKFESHEGYDGVFIGLEDAFAKPNSWHLEFTVSWEQPLHRPDEDDLLVFYPDNTAEYETILKKLQIANIKRYRPKNNYWYRNGVTVLDPDGYGVVIVNPNRKK
ncbi:MAG: hypothetical protein ACI8ZM_002319 [Crocinitomix sp.]|jgi:hypothetical protein